MRIAINMTNCRGRGSSQVSMGILKAMLQSGSTHSFTAWIPDSWDTRHLDGLPNLRLFRISPGALRRVWSDFTSAGRFALRQLRMDCLVTLGDTPVPCPGVPQVVFVQQAYLAYPRSEWGFRIPPALSARTRAIETYFQFGRRSVTGYVVQSEAMRRRLAERWQIDPASIRVIPSPVTYPSPIDTCAPNAQQRHDGDLNRMTVAYVATASWHKNHAVLLQAMTHSLVSHLTLVLTLSPRHVRELGLEQILMRAANRVRCVGYLSHLAAMRLLQTATCTAIPSTLESYGLTYYEAMHVGCPIIAADRDFAREACGPAAVYARHDSPEAFATQIATLSGDSSSRRRLAESGRRRVADASMTWQSVGTHFLSAVYDAVGLGAPCHARTPGQGRRS